MLSELLFFADDYLARGALPVLLEQGVRVPSGVRIATLPNRGFPPAFPPPFDGARPCVCCWNITPRV